MAGQIINRGKGAWLVRVYLGLDPASGKRQYHNSTVHGNKKDAEGKLTDLLRSRNTGALTVRSESLMIGDLLDDVVRDYRINGKSVAFAEFVMKRLMPTFAKIAVSSIRPKHVDKYIEERRAAGWANATINHDLSMLRRAFSLARQKGTLLVAPLTIPKLEENNVRKGFFEQTEFSLLRAALPDEIKPILTFAYYTGCRRGEILGLQWSQVDLINRMVRLEPGETKNSEARMIPLRVEELYRTLEILREARDREFPDCPWVFARQGERIRTFRGTWNAACQSVGLWDAEKKHPTRIFHDLRRTGVRNLIRAGVPEKVAMLISGHKTRSVFERYNIVDERDVSAAMSRLDAYSREREKAEETAKQKRAATNRHTIRTQTAKVS